MMWTLRQCRKNALMQVLFHYQSHSTSERAELMLRLIGFYASPNADEDPVVATLQRQLPCLQSLDSLLERVRGPIEFRWDPCIDDRRERAVTVNPTFNVHFDFVAIATELERLRGALAEDPVDFPRLTALIRARAQAAGDLDDDREANSGS